MVKICLALFHSRSGNTLSNTGGNYLTISLHRHPPGRGSKPLRLMTVLVSPPPNPLSRFNVFFRWGANFSFKIFGFFPVIGTRFLQARTPTSISFTWRIFL